MSASLSPVRNLVQRRSRSSDSSVRRATGHSLTGMTSGGGSDSPSRQSQRRRAQRMCPMTARARAYLLYTSSGAAPMREAWESSPLSADLMDSSDFWLAQRSYSAILRSRSAAFIGGSLWGARALGPVLDR